MKPSRLALFAVLSWSSAATAEPASDERRHAVETGLRAAVTFDGVPSPHWALAERMQRYGVPAVSIVLLRNGAIDWRATYRLPDSPAVTDNTQFQAASISKGVTGALAMRLREAGKIDLDADVEPALRPLRLPQGAQSRANPITLRKLLTHTAGTNVAGFPGYARDQPIPSDEQVILGRSPANTPPVAVVTTPGTRYAYSGGGYTIAERVLERQLGSDFATLMQRWVLTPLDMRDSSFAPTLPADFAAGHLSDGRLVAGGAHIYPEQAAAGLWTTPSDLAKFLLAVRNSARGDSDFLSRRGAEELLTPHLEQYGLGVAVLGAGDTLRFTHQGGNAGYKARYVMYVARGDGVIVMTNSDNGMALVNEIFRAASSVYGWSDFQPRDMHAIAADLPALRAFGGRYRYDAAPERGSDEVEFVADAGRLGVVLPDLGFVALVATAPSQLVAPETGMMVELGSRDSVATLKLGSRSATRIVP